MDSRRVGGEFVGIREIFGLHTVVSRSHPQRDTDGMRQMDDLLGRRMVERGRGALVFVSSVAGFHGSAMVGTYAASKAFDTVLGEGLWEELGHHGVDVMVCAPPGRP